MMSLKTKAVVSMILFCMAGPIYCLEPSEIAVIVNTNVTDSVALGDYYCQQRHIPAGNLIRLVIPASESISNLVYNDEIAPAIRARLLEEPFKGKIKCLVTTYGVPLRINAFTPTAALQQKKQFLDRQINQKFSELEKLTEEFKNQNPAITLIMPKEEAQKEKTPFQMPGWWIQRDKKAVEMLKLADETMWAAQKAIRNMVDAGAKSRRMEAFNKLFQQYTGLEGQVSALAGVIKQQPKHPDIESFNKSYQQGYQELVALATLAGKMAGEESGFEEEKINQRYDIIMKASGLKGLCQVIIADRRLIGDEDSEAAFDSELSLVLREKYSYGGMVANPLLVKRVEAKGEGKAPAAAAPNKTEAEVLMVARLDGPTVEIARGLVDMALAGEAEVLKGNVYLDGRGITKDSESFGSYGYFDDKLRRTAELLQKQPGLKVTLDDKPALFAVGQCPDAILYCGWYSLRNYVDSFTFQPGAVGFHIASFEAETLRNQSPQDTNQWCKRLLEHGITATIGAVAEPYLHTFPRPDTFFADWITGQYTLAETFYRNVPNVSWRIILIGDPLYKPKFK